jgi:hypothetical protein
MQYSEFQTREVGEQGWFLLFEIQGIAWIVGGGWELMRSSRAILANGPRNRNPEHPTLDNTRHSTLNRGLTESN